MAGATGFSGMPLGSFSGRGADLSPFQFILEQRARAAQQAEQKKLAQQQMQQSFTMALMAKKQQEAEMAQQGQQFQAQQQQRIAEKNMAAEQFRSEQDRIREASRAQDELRRMGEARLNEQNDRILENQRRDDERRSLADAKKANDERNLMGVAGHVDTMGSGAFRKFAMGPDIAALEAEVAAARREERSAPQTSEGAAAALQRIITAEAALATAKVAEAPDPLDALDKAEEALRFHVSSIPDAGVKAAYIAAIAKWKDKQEADILRRDAKKDYKESRKLAANDRAEGRAIQSFNAKVASVKAANAPIEKQIAKLEENAVLYEQVAELEAGTQRAKNATAAAGKLRDKIAELEKKLVPIPVMQ